MRKSLIVIFILLIALFLVYISRPWIAPNTYVSGWGAGSSGVALNQNNSTQKVSFTATIKNNGHYPVYVKEVKALFTEPLKSSFKSGNQIVPIKKWLKPNETTVISGEWLFETSAIKDLMIGSHVTFKVQTFPF